MLFAYPTHLIKAALRLVDDNAVWWSSTLCVSLFSDDVALLLEPAGASVRTLLILLTFLLFTPFNLIASGVSTTRIKGSYFYRNQYIDAKQFATHSHVAMESVSVNSASPLKQHSATPHKNHIKQTHIYIDNISRFVEKGVFRVRR